MLRRLKTAIKGLVFGPQDHKSFMPHSMAVTRLALIFFVLEGLFALMNGAEAAVVGPARRLHAHKEGGEREREMASKEYFPPTEETRNNGSKIGWMVPCVPPDGRCKVPGDQYFCLTNTRINCFPTYEQCKANCPPCVNGPCKPPLNQSFHSDDNDLN